DRCFPPSVPVFSSLLRISSRICLRISNRSRKTLTVYYSCIDPPLEVARNHGVYVVDEESGELLRVLQKPSEEEMRESGGVRGDEDSPWCFTESSYFLSSRLVSSLLDHVGDLHEMEICTYGDFLRPLGKGKGDLSSIDSSSDLAAWHRALYACFNECKTELVDCGPSSFFHFGSLKECREHWYGVMGGREIPVHSTWEFKIGHGSIVDYNNLPPTPFMVVGRGASFRDVTSVGMRRLL
ncbi:hypothetical protein PMAYCL1PPCAC_14682, partial [Pristionchus mayeri]